MFIMFIAMAKINIANTFFEFIAVFQFEFFPLESFIVTVIINSIIILTRIIVSVSLNYKGKDLVFLSSWLVTISYCEYVCMYLLKLEFQISGIRPILMFNLW